MYQKTDPSMIQCENCLEWYHFPCIIRNKKSLECITTTSSENITFLCGECDKEQCCMIVDNDGEITDFSKEMSSEMDCHKKYATY